jgi:hypothetical protein
VQPHQERVVAELQELAERRRKLEAFIDGSPIFGALPRDEQKRMLRQQNVMREYEDVLRDRVAHFPEPVL